jgi:hypothetical protein
VFKFAFIMNIPGESPETYSKVFENEEEYDLFVGSGDMETAAWLVKKYAGEGFDLIDLCGDFNEELAKEFTLIAENKLKVFYADYFPEELAKLEAQPSLKEYGIICIADGLKKMEHLELTGKTCNTSVMLVTDLDMACRAARELLDKGINFIELCSWFDAGKTRTVIAAVDGRVPVGSCGLHS